MSGRPVVALDVAHDYLDASTPILNESNGVRYTAVFLETSPGVSLAEPSVWPLLRASYALSLLERGHLACVVTLARNHRWLNGAFSGVRSNNLLAFSSCLRGFLEAAADSHDVLQYLPLALVEGREFFYTALHHPALVKQEYSFGELEDRLIHFAFARRQRGGIAVPPSHNPKPTTDYIGRMQDYGVQGAVELYAELCQLTHPASPSVDCFLVEAECSYTLNFNGDEDHIRSLLERHNEVLLKLLMHSFNPALTCLAFLARLVPEWPAPFERGLQNVALATRNLPLFDELPLRFGPPTSVASFQQALALMLQKTLATD